MADPLTPAGSPLNPSSDTPGSPPAEAPTAPEPVRREDPVVDTRFLRLFGSGSFFRLWLAQVVSSLGDWIGLVAVLAIAQRIGGRSPEASIAIVMVARMLPGFFLASVGGVLVDRWDRKRIMVVCDMGRGAVMATLPFVHSVWGLVLVSLVLEVFSSLWTPAKEASVPNLVRAEQLDTANSLSLAAAYGTFPVGTGVFAALTLVARVLGQHVHFFRVTQESLAIYFDVATFFVSAGLISTLVLPRRRDAAARGRIDVGDTFAEAKEGWGYIRTTPIVRAVLVGLGTGLIGGAMVVPLGPQFSREVLHGGPAGFGLLLTAMGVGVAVGVLGLSATLKRLPRERVFPLAVMTAGTALLAAASMSSLALAMVFVACMGVASGAAYVVGFSLLQSNVDDDLRGRIFAALYVVIRICVVAALTIAPVIAALLRPVAPGTVHLGGATFHLTAVRITLWFGGAIVLVAGVLARQACRQHVVAE